VADQRVRRAIHTRFSHPPVPVEAYLKQQVRFSRFFEPQPNERTLGEIQAQVDKYCAPRPP